MHHWVSNNYPLPISTSASIHISSVIHPIPIPIPIIKEIQYILREVLKPRHHVIPHRTHIDLLTLHHHIAHASKAQIAVRTSWEYIGAALWEIVAVRMAIMASIAWRWHVLRAVEGMV